MLLNIIGVLECWLLHEGTVVSTGFLAQASVSRVGEADRGSPRSFARVVAQATNLHFEQGDISLRRGGLA
ncbi:hypothetical protein DEO72_LG6g1538 [Vigna unguiculata]|uniref:Uncharacterized protein n=1 Tax=Vigna unguiculata TaxID=3917 RepID=A0A4D6M8J4_VIGUN|nr:hypothetical protein DEO72_LG6g1538 [Vigna unguiculata]